MNSTCFLTGGSGFVGGAILRHLIADGAVVGALARSEAAAATVADLGATPVRVDLLDVDGLAAAMAGSEVVYHAAGVNAMCARSTADMFVTNVAGTRAVVAAASRAGVRRVVLTSSVTAAGPMTSAYARSKRLGETAGLELGRAREIEVVAVRPASVQGPGRTDGSARLLLYLLRTRRPWLVESTFSLVDVDDCAESHLRAATRGEPGRTYVISAGTVTSTEVAALLAGAGDREVRPRVVPRWLAAGVGFLPALVAEVWPGELPLCREALATMVSDHRHDGAVAAAELGLVYRPIPVTLARAAVWYTQVGLA